MLTVTVYLQVVVSQRTHLQNINLLSNLGLLKKFALTYVFNIVFYITFVLYTHRFVNTSQICLRRGGVHLTFDIRPKTTCL